MSSNQPEVDQLEDSKENLWNKLLSENRDQENLSKDATLLVIGESRAGKKTLINALEKLSGEKLILESRNDKSLVSIMKDKKLASMIDFFYFTIKNPDDDNMELGKIKTYFIDENASDDLIKLMVKKEDLSNLMVMVVLDFEQYPSIADAIPKWINYITQKIAPLYLQIDLETSDSLKAKMENIVKNYHEPFKNEHGEILNKRSQIEPDTAENLQLPEGCLNPNFGFPILFVLNKADTILELKNLPNADEILEMIEYYLRTNLVNLSATIVYTSTKMNINLEILLDYLKHLGFGLPFRFNSNVSKDSLFVPIGLDNPQFLESAYSSSTIKEKSFDAVIARTDNNKKKLEDEIIVREHQAFLKSIKQQCVVEPTTGGIEETEQPVSARDRVKPSTGFDKKKTESLLKLLES